MGLLDGIINNGRQSKGVLDELIVNANQNNLPGMDLRLMRGGFGDAFLNTDMPDPRLVQSQMWQVQKAAAPESLQLLSLLLSPLIQRNLISQTSKMPDLNLLQNRNRLGQFARGFIRR